MFKLYGQKERCLWCGEADKVNYQETSMNIKFANPPEEKTIVCSDACAKKVSETCQFIERGIVFYVVGVTIGSILSLAATFSPLVGKDLMPFTIAGLFILGITLLVTPFVTPQTVQLLGLKKAMFSGRICEIITVIVASILLLRMMQMFIL